jgi:hypothetical protein
MRRQALILFSVAACLTAAPAFADPRPSTRPNGDDSATAPADNSPKPDLPDVPAPGPARPNDPSRPRVQFVPATKDLNLARVTSAEKVTEYEFRDVSYFQSTTAYLPLCRGECETAFPRGTFELALYPDGEHPLSAGRVRIDGPTLLRGTYEDRSGRRLAGLLIALGGVAAGFALIIPATDGSQTNGPVLGLGSGVAVAALAVGAYLGFQADHAHIEVVPLETKAASRDPGVRSGSVQGAALRVAF